MKKNKKTIPLHCEVMMKTDARMPESGMGFNSVRILFFEEKFLILRIIMNIGVIQSN